MATLNVVLHAAACLLALAAFIQAQVELADVKPDWHIQFHYDDRRQPQQERVNVSWLDWHLALVTLPTALHHLYMAWPWHSAEWWDRYNRRRVSRLRWLEYSITSTAMTTRIAVLSGVNDLATLVTLAVLSITMIALGGVHEWLYRLQAELDRPRPALLRRSAKPRPDERRPRHLLADALFWGSSILFLVQWGIMLTAFERGTSSNGAAPSWVVAIFIGLIVLDTGFPVVAWLNARGLKAPRYLTIDAAYALLSLTVKQFYIQTLLYGYRSYRRDA